MASFQDETEKGIRAVLFYKEVYKNSIQASIHASIQALKQTAYHLRGLFLKIEKRIWTRFEIIKKVGE